MITVKSPESDVFQAALQGVSARYVLSAKPQRDWRLTRIDLHGVGLMQGREGAANICCGAAVEGYFNVLLSLSGREPIIVDGQRLDAGKIGWMAPGRIFHRESSLPVSWLRVTLPNDAVESWFSANGATSDPALLTRNHVKTASQPVAELVRLAHRVFEVDSPSGGGRLDPAQGRAIRREVLDAVFRAMRPASDAAEPTRRVPHGVRVLNRALALIASRPEAQIHTEDLCRITGVSERTLRNVFRQHFRMAPHQYLMLARLHDIRAAIREAGDGATVSSICADFSVWDFGRFAAQYRRLFGVLPSLDLAVRRKDAFHGRFRRNATFRSSVARGYSPNSA